MKYFISVFLASLMLSCSCGENSDNSPKETGDSPSINVDSTTEKQKNSPEEIDINNVDSLFLATNFKVQISNDSLLKNLVHEQNSTIYVNSSEYAFIGDIFEDNTTIIVKNNLSDCHLIFLNVTVQGNLKIIADGYKGLDGVVGNPHPHTAGTNQNGDPGNFGGNGQNGGNGVNLEIDGRFKKIGKVISISSRGGHGGSGGRGGQGKTGGKADCAPPKSAGRGGVGGQGGNGGDAGKNGNVFVKILNTDIDADAGRFSNSEEIGLGGIVGDGGSGGFGGAGSTCPWPLGDHSPGPSGPVGPKGTKQGNNGTLGNYRIESPRN